MKGIAFVFWIGAATFGHAAAIHPDPVHSPHGTFGGFGSANVETEVEPAEGVWEEE